MNDGGLTQVFIFRFSLPCTSVVSLSLIIVEGFDRSEVVGIQS